MASLEIGDNPAPHPRSIRGTSIMSETSDLDRLVTEFRRAVRDARAGRKPPIRREGAHVIVGEYKGPPMAIRENPDPRHNPFGPPGLPRSDRPRTREEVLEKILERIRSMTREELQAVLDYKPENAVETFRTRQTQDEPEPSEGETDSR